MRAKLPKHTLTAIVLVLSFAAPVAAGPFEAHSRGNYQKALRLIRPLADDGDAVASGPCISTAEA